MNTITITENREEMIAIAKEIAEEKKKYYNAPMFRFLTDYVRDMMPDATAQEIEDTVYLTIYHYWVYGATYEEYFYYHFAEKSHEEKQSYMTFRLRLQYIDHISKKEDAHILSNKYETYQLFTKEYDRDVILCNSDADYPVFKAFAGKHSEFVVKPTVMSGGKGVYKTGVAGLNEEELEAFYRNLLSESRSSQEKYLHGDQESVVIEELIDQADELAVFHPASVNSIRVPTLLINGEVKIYQPWFKIGRDGHFLTSSLFGSLIAGVDAETGIVDTVGMTQSGEEWASHPDTHQQILGFQIPRWEELKEMSADCARRLPMFGYVGWDFALSKKGWCIMEGNHSGNFMWQLFRKRGMKKDFEDLIGWKLDKEFWWQ
ncbi:MAG: hypothetical protein IK080_07410 [Clostridia bacterium]|nr:hypothetical protein [Clostridia bacterium]